MAGTGILARAWLRSQPVWWGACAVVLAIVCALVLVVEGTFTGMQSATESRVADFFTSDLRVTPARTGAAVPDLFAANQTQRIAAQLAAAGGPGTVVIPRYESQFILSRRNFIEAYFEEHNRYEVNMPGTSPATATFYGAGVLVGIPMDRDGAVEGIASHLVSGRLPSANPDETELLMSVSAFQHYLSTGERANVTTWPPAAPELASFHFEVTAGRVDESGPIKDLVRKPARVVGLFTTGLDVLDGFAVVTDMASAQALSGLPVGPNGAANAFTVHGGHTAAVAQEAAANGWPSEGAGPFAQHYIGQLLLVIRALSVLLSGVFFALPVFLVWYGLQQMLDRQRRELGVCRAIGVPAGVLRRAILLLVCLVAAGAALLCAGLVAGWSLGASWLFSQINWPLPIAFVVPAHEVAIVALVAVLSAALAYALAMRRARLQDLGRLLRAA